MLKNLFAAASLLIAFDAAAADEVPAKVDPDKTYWGGGFYKPYQPEK